MKVLTISSLLALAVFVSAAPILNDLARREDATPPMDIVGCYGCTGGKRDAEPEPEPVPEPEPFVEKREDAIPPMDIVGCYGCTGGKREVESTPEP